MQLYTVILQNSHSVTRFDTRGKVIERKQTLVEQTIRDLPYSTAQMYLKTSAEGHCKVITQSANTEGRGDRVRFGDAKQRRAEHPAQTKLSPHPKVTRAERLAAAAATGDLSAAINAGE